MHFSQFHEGCKRVLSRGSSKQKDVVFEEKNKPMNQAQGIDEKKTVVWNATVEAPLTTVINKETPVQVEEIDMGDEEGDGQEQ